MPVIKRLKKIEEAVARIETILAIGALGVMVLVGFTQIVLRIFFSMGFLWADELLRQLVLWVGFLGASLATRHDEHIDVDVFTRLLPKKGQLVSGLLSHLIGGMVCIFLGDAAVGFVRSEYELGEVLRSLHLPFWILQIILPFAFFTISFRFFLGALDIGLQIMNPVRVSRLHRTNRRITGGATSQSDSNGEKQRPERVPKKVR